MVVIFCGVLFRTWIDIWIVWWVVREWREVDLSPGKSLTIRILTGLYDDYKVTQFEYLKSLKEIEIPNSQGVMMSVDNVELLIKERDLEYNLEFCDIFVTGIIL